MLEGIVANLLNRFLGLYVKDFDAGQLNVGIWSGDVKLRNLELRREALDQLKFALNVVEGYLGQLTLSIPWSNLRSKPVRIDIEDVFLLAAPREDSTWNPEDDKRRAQALKIEKLESAEILKEQNRDRMSPEDRAKDQSFTQSLVTAIVDNMQVVIKNVHIRYEDSIANATHPFAAGFTIKELSAISTDADWNPTFIQSASGTSFKLATLEAFALYWDTDATLFSNGVNEMKLGHDVLMEKLRSAIEDKADSQYMLKPVSVKSGIELDKTGEMNKPHLKIRLLLNELAFVLDEQQYKDALMLMDMFHSWVRSREYRSLRPKSSLKEDPRAWLRYAGQVILNKIHERNRRWSPDFIKERREDRLRYTDLFKKKKRGLPFTPGETADLDRLEEKHSYEDLRFWRSLTRSQLRKEKLTTKSQEQSKQQSWSEWLFGGKKEEEKDVVMTDEHRKELYEAIDWDEKKAISESVDVPRDYVKYQVDLSLNTGSFAIKRDPHGKATEIVKLAFDRFSSKVKIRPDSYLLHVDLADLRIYDGTTPGTRFPQIVWVKDIPSRPLSNNQELADRSLLRSNSESGAFSASDDSLFHAQFEVNPLDGSANTALTMRLKGIEVIHNPRIWVEVFRFFSPPERNMDTVNVLLASASAKVEGIRQQTRAGLQFALDEHKTLNAQLDIRAPLFIIPETVTVDDPLCLFVDAGHLNVSSKLVSKKDSIEIQSKHDEKSAQENFGRIEDMMFDKFDIKLDSAQMLLGHGVESTKKLLSANTPGINLHIIHKINVDFVAELCILQQSVDLPRIRVSGHLPELHASASDEKYKNLMKIIDVAIPHFEDEESSSSHNVSRRSSALPLGTDEISDIESESASLSADIIPGPPADQRRKIFEFKFTVDTLRGSLYRSVPGDDNPDKLLAEIIASKFHMDYEYRPSEMRGDLTLQSLSADDYIEENLPSDFKQIITSRSIDQPHEKTRNLFFLKFTRSLVKDESSSHETAEMDVDLEISTINVVVTRRTLLTLLDLVMITFTDQNQEPPVTTEETDNKGTMPADSSTNGGSGPIRVKSRFEGISLILNDDGVRLATIKLTTADTDVFLRGPVLRVNTKLGSLTVVDDSCKDGSSRRLVSIEGNDLAELTYQTCDPQSNDSSGYTSEVFLRSDSIRINFIDEPFHKLVNFLVRFGKMQAVFTTARQAAAKQAIQETASLMRFNAVVKAPIIVFPRITQKEGPRDFMTANLGEFYAHNEFRSIDGSEGQLANIIYAGIRHVRLTSNFYYDDKEVEELEIMENVDVDFEINYFDISRLKLERPDIQVGGSMSPITLRISQTQLRFLIGVLQKIPTALIPDAFPQESEELQSLLPQSRQDYDQPSGQVSQDQPSDQVNHHIDLNFKAGTISLELILAKQGRKVGDLAKASLSKFLINGSEINLRQMNDGSLNAELCLHSFNVLDSRAGQPTCFPRVMSLISNDVKDELTANITMPAGSQKDAMLTLTIDSPRIILALDHMFALQSFLNQAFSSDDTEQNVAHAEPVAEPSRDSRQQRSSLTQVSQLSEQGQSSFTFSTRVSIINPQMVLVTNPAIPNTEAIVLGSKEMVFVKQKTINLTLSSVGMFICRMDKFDTERLRILDDFALNLSLNTEAPVNSPPRTLLDVHIDPLVLRLSLRDILLAIQIINEASNILIRTNRSIHDTASQSNPETPFTPLSKTSSTATEEHGALSPSHSQSRSPSRPQIEGDKDNDNDSAIAGQRRAQTLKTEELIAQIDGIRVIIIGEVHELPLFDFQVGRFDVELRDWSSLVSADTTIKTSMHVFNFSKSAWEPLIEPWQFGFHMVRELEPSCLSMEVYSHKTMEISVSSSTIALASRSFEILSSDEDVLSKPRGASAPYRLRNYTGFELSVWTGNGQGRRGPLKRLRDGEEYPWQFEGAMTIRQTLTPEGETGTVNIRLEDSGFSEISSIPLVREGEFLYSLYPKMDGVKHRLLVEVCLHEDNVKYITFRSPFVIDNKTQIPIELGVYDPNDGSLLRIHKISAGDSRCAPIVAAYRYAVLIRPDPGFGYQWSTEALKWRDLLNRPARTLCCKTEVDEHNLQNNSPAFFFQVNAIHDQNSPVNRFYPHMRLRISAPLEIENLLPYDFKYRVYDRTTRRDWTNFLRKGLISPVHVVEISHLLLLNVDIQDTDFRRGEFAIINGDPEEDFYREHTLVVDNQQDMQLRLRLHYFTIPDSGGAFKVTIYSPYVILNMTGLNLLLQSRTSSRDNTVHRISTDSSRVRKALPYMYSYKDKNRRNRTALQVDGSDWTKPQSFEAIGSNYEVSFPSQHHSTDYHAGVNVEEGQGKYNLSKVIKITPRFILKNKLGEDLMAREPRSSSVIILRPNDLVPLHFLQRRPERQLCLSFASGFEDNWSAPFFIDELGSVYVKLSRPNLQQKLVRVDLLMENATIFVHISSETSHWPFSLRNESDAEFLFFQANPNVTDEEDPDPKELQARWRPIKYRLPPRSVMPYAWDYPASKNKSLVVVSNGIERTVKLAEIGNLVPLKLPGSRPNDKPKIIDINIVAEGPTQALILSNFRPSRSMYRPQNPTRGQEGDLASNFKVKHVSSEPTFRFSTRFAGIGVSLINQNMKELLYMSLRDIEFRYNDSQLYETVDLLIKWVQVDNQLYGGIFPILVYPSVVAENNRELEAHPVFRGNIVRVKDDSYGVLYIKYASILMQQMTVELDEDFVFAMLEFLRVPGASWTTKSDGKLCDETLDIPEPSPQEQTRDVYLEVLHLQPMQIDLSFVRTERINAEDKMKVSTPLMFIVNVLTMSLGNVNDAPVRFNALLLENARLSGSTLFHSVNDHYVQEFIGQIHLIIGSADFLGNPVGLFNTVSSGVADMFYEPYQGVIMADRPHEQFGIGIARGASSFAKKFVFGFSDSFSKLTGSVSKGFAAASLDKEFQEQRRMVRYRNRPKHALYGIAAGGNAFASSMASGIGGLARLPFEGAEKDGLEGFVKGVGKGFLGLATKPAVGLFDFASNLAEGVRNTTTVLQSGGLDKVRLTRFIGIDGIVRPYSAREALGQFWLKTCDDGKYFHEDYIAHLETPDPPTIVILTYNRILILRSKSMKTVSDIKLTDIHTISKVRTGMSITLEGNVSGPFIAIEDEAPRNWLYQQIAIAVNAFNERYGASN